MRLTLSKKGCTMRAMCKSREGGAAHRLLPNGIPCLPDAWRYLPVVSRFVADNGCGTLCDAADRVSGNGKRKGGQKAYLPSERVLF